MTLEILWDFVNVYCAFSELLTGFGAQSLRNEARLCTPCSRREVSDVQAIGCISQD